MEALRRVVRWRPIVSPRDRAQPDPTRWLPADFAPSANRYVVQRRPNLRRLPRWKRPDHRRRRGHQRTGRDDGRSCARRACSDPRSTRARGRKPIARQWLERYGVVSREMWRRERPPIGWRSDLSMSSSASSSAAKFGADTSCADSAGAQFALPEAVEMLRRPDDAGRATRPS